MHTRHSQVMIQYLAPWMMLRIAKPTRHDVIMPMTMPGVMKINMTTATVPMLGLRCDAPATVRMRVRT